jgi:hypothetical protein
MVVCLWHNNRQPKNYFVPRDVLRVVKGQMVAQFRVQHGLTLPHISYPRLSRLVTTITSHCGHHPRGWASLGNESSDLALLLISGIPRSCPSLTSSDRPSSSVVSHRGGDVLFHQNFELFQRES